MLDQVISQNMFLFGLLIVWILIWKGLALWKAGTKKDKIWFIIILILNSGGILDIIYVFLISKRESLKNKPEKLETNE